MSLKFVQACLGADTTHNVASLISGNPHVGQVLPGGIQVDKPGDSFVAVRIVEFDGVGIVNNCKNVQLFGPFCWTSKLDLIGSTAKWDKVRKYNWNELRDVNCEMFNKSVYVRLLNI